MKTLPIVSALLIAGASIAAHPARQHPPQSQPPAVKLTGCLQHADEQGQYLLTQVQPPSGHDRYMVKPLDKSVLLSSHVGHTVDLTGTVTEAKGGTSAQQTPTLTATEVKMVSATCAKDVG